MLLYLELLPMAFVLGDQGQVGLLNLLGEILHVSRSH